MDDVMENGNSIDWQKQCISLETQLIKFRQQAGKIREQLAEKMQELEKRITEAESRAETAEKQVQVMQEKLKSSNVKTSESENTLYKRYQDLTSMVHEKDAMILRLETQLEKQAQLRAQEAKLIEEKAAKIKEWVTLKLKELEMENFQLKLHNHKQMEQIQSLLKQFQVVEKKGHLVGSSQSCPQLIQRLLISPLTEKACQFSKDCSNNKKQTLQASEEGDLQLTVTVTVEDNAGEEKDSKTSPRVETTCFDWSIPAATSKPSMNCTDDRMVPSQLTKCSLSPLRTKTEKEFQSLDCKTVSVSSCISRTAERGNLCNELNTKFHSQRLAASSSSSEINMPSPITSPALTPDQPSSFSVPSTASLQLSPPIKDGSVGNSMTLPKARTPVTPRDSLQLAKKHYSQPQVAADHIPHVVNIDMCSFKPIALPLHSLQAEETDIDDIPDEMDTDKCEDAALETASLSSLSLILKESVSPEITESDPVIKPPTPPLHRFPSWESRIYAVAKSGMRLSEVTLGNGPTSKTTNLQSCTVSGPFAHLIYKNVAVPVYTTLKGKATQISNIPFHDDSSGSDDDASSLASFRASSVGSEPKKGSIPGSPRAVKRGVSMSSMSSESDYAIPPDACSVESDYSEPEHKLLRTSTYSMENGCNESLEKSGYLLKMGSKVKTWKRRWFVLRNGEMMYYKSPSDIIRKPQGQIELNSSCRIVRVEGTQTFQLITEKKTYYLTADSPNILEEWVRTLQGFLKIRTTSSPVIQKTNMKPTVKGWLTKVKHGYSKVVWCAVNGKVFYYYRNHEDKYPLGHLNLQHARVEEVDRSCDSDEDYEAGGRGFLSSHFTLVIHPKDQSPTYLHIGTKYEKATWLYHLTVAAGSSSVRVGTEYEQLISQLMDIDGAVDSAVWKHPVLCYSKDGILSSLTTLPSEALQTEALKLFKSCQLFINVSVEASSIDYHVSLAQSILQVCLTHAELQNEIYCQLIKQTSHRQPQNYSLIQCWQLLALCAALFLPQNCFLWYLKLHLQRHADPRLEIGKYAIYCQQLVERTLQNGDREAKPSRLEIISILLRNPYHHSLPFSIPVHFLNGTYQVAGFDGSTTVDEFLHTLNQETGMRKSYVSGFALFTDDPSGKDCEHCLQGSVKICDVISKWEQVVKELHPGKYEGTRVVRLTYKNRMYFRRHAKGETERERLLLAYQVNDEIVNGRFPVNKELSLEIAALMAQVEYGDFDRPVPSSPGGSSQTKAQHLLLQVLDKFYPKHYKQSCTSEQLRHIADRLATKWMVLRGCTAPECVRIYLTVARKWPFYGAKLFAAKPALSSSLEKSLLWLAVNEDGVSILEYNSMHLIMMHPYQSVLTFGGYQDDFMLVVSQKTDGSSGKVTIEKLIFVMAKPKIVEITLLIARYINFNALQPSCIPSQSPCAGSPLSATSEKRLYDIESKHFPAPTLSSKGPTLL
ncbi:pleckstrin homology domain-containing family H member 1-like [Protopterus annectens]|uniref:pleckstrin homology domain-containing family H member 1-like n=1 Tax=Protopterus annectens TaxID=7888 RepID=UPI001CF9B2FA|nr:pleckstrin homology domain-containing family H member 1-like [Protopterus annectens]XP_043930048.1 pleckstrin homology domain-containing family H member 1-like [Protopterus annectens]